MVDDGRRTDGRRTDGRTTEHGYTISSPCEPDGSGELKIQMLFIQGPIQDFWKGGSNLQRVFDL